MVCALLEASHSKRGQVVDAAMTDGSALLGALMYGLKAAGRWSVQRDANLLDGAAHFYDTYECADGKYIAIGSIEPQFYAELLKHTGSDAEAFKRQMDPRTWPELKRKLAAQIKIKSRDEWCKAMEGTDVCFAPVLDMNEAPLHPHNQARKTFVDIGGVMQPAPAPRFSRTGATVQSPPATVGEHSETILRAWGFSDERVAGLKARGIV
jgi:alpha-methylacyl-CoA racemase